MMNKKLMILVFALAAISCQDPKNNQQNNRDTVNINEQYYIETGDKIVAESCKSLSSNLMSAMKAGGVKNAAGFCHIEAQPLTDSLSNHFNTEIHRVALKYRNPNNALNRMDKVVFEDYLSTKQLQPQLETSQDKITYYKPILLAKPCLKCHGAIGEDISEEDYAYLTELYPDDRAVGFKEGDLRGLWRISFNANSTRTE
jgi:hypothetical protein